MKHLEIITIGNCNQIEFERQVNSFLKLKKGWEISSTSCSLINSEAYNFSSYYMAILIKKEI